MATRGVGLPALRRPDGSGPGQGVVTAASYEYGNTFLIVSGLLNMLVALDAYDVALGAEVMTSHLAAAGAVRVLRRAGLRRHRARRAARSRRRFGVRIFGGFVGAGLVLGWLMYPLPL